MNLSFSKVYGKLITQQSRTKGKSSYRHWNHTSVLGSSKADLKILQWVYSFEHKNMSFWRQYDIWNKVHVTCRRCWHCLSLHGETTAMLRLCYLVWENWFDCSRAALSRVWTRWSAEVLLSWDNWVIWVKKLCAYTDKVNSLVLVKYIEGNISDGMHSLEEKCQVYPRRFPNNLITSKLSRKQLVSVIFILYFWKLL